ncbi:tetratricopeptide repeat protein 21B [Trichonephila inaurata madagascariensis]|uniref:Tetratricopeptide repeat protein 21B n=1 Tax=Trichonephila inaurata madagascariensis TaxID=2747483 RepID=A0A8X6YD75_9ARAC|nr:tetratricopeptide repeat protein 21B [Trichonephila inaurata madagascariensis]
MADRSSYIEDSVIYYCRARMYRTMQISAVEGIKRYPDDPVYKLYYCVSLIYEDRNGEAEEGLNEIEDIPDVSLSCSILLSHIQQPQESFDNILRGKAKEHLEVAGENAMYITGVVFMLLNKPEKARQFIKKVLKVPSLTKKASVLMGWIDMLTNEGSPSKDVWKYFETSDNSSPEAVFGRSKYYEKQENYAKALEFLNQAIVLFPKYPPTFIEKMKIHLTLEDWDQTLVAAQRALLLDGNNIEALRFKLMHLLTQGGKIEEIEDAIKTLYTTMMKCEPKNAELFFESAQLFSRLSGLQKRVIEVTFSMAKKASELKPNDPEINAEYGYQYLYLGKPAKALSIFKTHACDRAVTGSMQCLIAQGEYTRASEQIQVYEECGTEFSPETLYISAFLSDYMSNSSETVVNYLNNAIKLHLNALKGIPWSVKFYITLQPLLVGDICQLLILHVPSQVTNSKSLFGESVKLCKTVVHSVHTSCPGFLGFSTAVMLAKFKMLEGDFSSAKTLLYQSVDKDDSNPEGRIVMAQLHLNEGNLYAASHCLEVALSFNFEVRENFDYLMIKAEIQKQQGLLPDAAETLNFAKTVAFLDIKKEDDLKSSKRIPISKKINLYVELIKIYCDLNKQDAANSAIHEANTLFRDTPEFDRLRFAVAYFALSRNDVNCALKILEEIKPDKSCYFEALKQRAEIYLNQRKNRIKYINCYREAVKEKNTPETLNLLGDAYMKIQEPENAVEAYEQALKQNPKDSDLASKIGTALVKTHNYEKAVTYYKAAIKSGGQENLRYDLCSLLCTIKRFKETEELINSALESGRGVDNLNWLAMESKYLCLLSDVYSKMEMEDQAMSTLQKAWGVQTRVLRKVHMEQADADEHRKKAKEICCQLAVYASRKKDYGSAVQFYREALTFDENDTEILLALAKLQFESHDIDAARQYCATVLSKDSENVPAAVLLADMMFEAGDLQSAKFQFQKLLDIKPDFFEAIARYIEVVRRLGKLEYAEMSLKKAESVSCNLNIDPGYYYCKGLYEWYTGNTSDALKCFNKTRSIPLWGQISLCHMIEICINPDNENFSGENVDVDGDLILKEKAVTSQEGNIRTTEKLLLELKSKYGANLNTRVFNNLIRLAKRNKVDAEAALNDFIEILTDERYKDHAGAILGSAMAYLVLKQTPRARNQLKRIAKTTWNFSDAEYLEKAWLLLADIYIKAGKFPSASEMLDKVLLYNKSCTKAYDLYGYIAEKEQNYRDAVKNFEKAWLLTSKLNPVIGYKLAFNNMKAKRYAEAIDVCQVVLSKYPNYPKIRKEILERSRTYLRT